MQKTWSNINELLKNKTSSNFPTFFLENKKKISDSNEIANKFNNYFTSVGKLLSEKIPIHPTVDFHNFICLLKLRILLNLS